MATNPIRIDPSPDERARPGAEIRRRGIDALSRLKDLSRGVPEISERALDEAISADRAEREARALRGSAD